MDMIAAAQQRLRARASMLRCSFPANLPAVPVAAAIINEIATVSCNP